MATSGDRTDVVEYEIVEMKVKNAATITEITSSIVENLEMKSAIFPLNFLKDIAHEDIVLPTSNIIRYPAIQQKVIGNQNIAKYSKNF